jgi:transposase-like protein
MSKTRSVRRARRRRPGGPRRWTAADKRAYLAAFATRGQTIKTFCAETGVPRATFHLWQREARDARRAPASYSRSDAPAFARVEVGPLATAPGITMIVRRPGELEAEVTGLDAAAVVAVLRGVLGPASA